MEGNDENQSGIGDSPEVSHEDEDPPPEPNSSTMTEQPPLSVGPTPDKSFIVSETIDIIRTNKNIICNQKHFLATAGFMVVSTMRLLDACRDLSSGLNAFLVNDSKLQRRWFCTYYSTLPQYGDYALVLNEPQEKELVDEVAAPVEQAVLKDLVESVVEMMHSCGTGIGAHYLLNKSVNSHLDYLRTITDGNTFPFCDWLDMLSTEIDNEDMLENQLFGVSSFLEFLNKASSPAKPELSKTV